MTCCGCALFCTIMIGVRRLASGKGGARLVPKASACTKIVQVLIFISKFLISIKHMLIHLTGCKDQGTQSCSPPLQVLPSYSVSLQQASAGPLLYLTYTVTFKGLNPPLHVLLLCPTGWRMLMAQSLCPCPLSWIPLSRLQESTSCTPSHPTGLKTGRFVQLLSHGCGHDTLVFLLSLYYGRLLCDCFPSFRYICRVSVLFSFLLSLLSLLSSCTLCSLCRVSVLFFFVLRSPAMHLKRLRFMTPQVFEFLIYTWCLWAFFSFYLSCLCNSCPPSTTAVHNDACGLLLFFLMSCLC